MAIHVPHEHISSLVSHYNENMGNRLEMMCNLQNVSIYHHHYPVCAFSIKCTANLSANAGVEYDAQNRFMQLSDNPVVEITLHLGK